MIGLIGAMDEEIELFKKNMKGINQYQKANMVFYTGKFLGKDVTLVKSGVSKVNAAVCTQVLIDKFKVNNIIFTGVAGAIDPKLNIGDIVISKDAVHHDIYVKFLGLERGQIPYSDLRFFEANKRLRDIAKKVKIKDATIIEGRILTGENFIEDQKIKSELRKELEGDCIEMEGAAVAQVCTLNKIPFLIIRTISDRAEGEASQEFLEFTKKVANNSLIIVDEIIKKLN